MSEQTLHTRKTPREIRTALVLFLAALQGRGGSDPSGQLEAFKLRLGTALLSVFHQAFLVKAKGGTDEAGITWAKLSREYVAYGRRHPGLDAKRKQAAAEGRPGRPLLSKDLDTLWRRTFAERFYGFLGEGSSSEDAKGHAAAIAWLVVKAAGGQTILGTYGDTQVEIGRDSWRLLNSLAPAIGGGSGEQVLRGEPGAVLVGTNRPGAKHFHGKRPLWPAGDRPFPREWREPLDDVSTTFFGQAIPRLVA